MNSRPLLTTFATILALTFSLELSAALRDYTAGWDMGNYDRNMPSPDQTDIYWTSYLEIPDQVNWDAYHGYVHGYGGLQQDYASIPPLGQLSLDSATYTKETTRYILIQQGCNRLMTNYRKMTAAPRIKSAAGALNNVSATFDVSYATVDDDLLGGDGDDLGGSLILNGMVGDDLLLAFGYSKNSYQVDDVKWDQSTDNLDFYATYQLTDLLNVGAFLTFSMIDIEDRQLPGINFPGDTFDRWGGGLLASTNVKLNDMADLGVVGTVASLNKSSIGAFGDDEDSAAVVMVDVTTFPTDSLTATVYASYFTLLDRENGPDGTYYIFGIEGEYKLSESAALKVGVETNAADNDRQEERLNLGLVVSF